MAKCDYDTAQTTLIKAIEKGQQRTFEEPIPVLVTLDNGVKYEGLAFEVQPASDNFPNGLVMVRAGSTDIGVPVRYLRGR